MNVSILGEGSRYLYAILSREEGAQLLLPNVRLVCISDVDWNRDLSPRPMKAIFRGQSDFSGGAADFLARLVTEVIPSVECGQRVACRAILGYSMAGLFALYAAAHSPCFPLSASVSGSLWFDGMPDDLAHTPYCPRRAYLSVGDRERLGRNPAFHMIEANTVAAERILADRGAETLFERNPGGHFDAPEKRMKRAAEWLMKEETK